MRQPENARRVQCVLITAAFVGFGVAGCGRQGESGPRASGDPAHGREVIAAVECGACHTIPGVRGANGIVGPPLAGFGERALIAGIFPNEPGVLAKWVRDAPSLVPNTGMPDLPISEADSADVAAFLYTLR